MNMLGRSMQSVGGRRGRWLTIAIWIVVVAALNIGLPSANDLKDDTLGNFGPDQPSVQARHIIDKEFASDEGIPALLTWHRASGLTDSDLQDIQFLSQSIATNPLPYQDGSVPLHAMPIQALKQQVSDDGTTLVQPVLFDRSVGSDEMKAGLTELETRTDAAFPGEHPFRSPVDAADSLIVRATGPAGISVDATGLFKDADVTLLMTTVLLVLVFLLLIYRSPVLALIPLIAVGFAYGAVTPLLGWMAETAGSHMTPNRCRL